MPHSPEDGGHMHDKCFGQPLRVISLATHKVPTSILRPYNHQVPPCTRLMTLNVSKAGPNTTRWSRVNTLGNAMSDSECLHSSPCLGQHIRQSANKWQRIGENRQGPSIVFHNFKTIDVMNKGGKDPVFDKTQITTGSCIPVRNQDWYAWQQGPCCDSSLLASPE